MKPHELGPDTTGSKQSRCCALVVWAHHPKPCGWLLPTGLLDAEGADEAATIVVMKPLPESIVCVLRFEWYFGC